MIRRSPLRSIFARSSMKTTASTSKSNFTPSTQNTSAHSRPLPPLPQSSSSYMRDHRSPLSFSLPLTPKKTSPPSPSPSSTTRTSAPYTSQPKKPRSSSMTFSWRTSLSTTPRAATSRKLTSSTKVILESPSRGKSFSKSTTLAPTSSRPV